MTLALKALEHAERDTLKSDWTSAFGVPPSPRLSTDTMRRILICEAQWRASGYSRAGCRKALQAVIAGDTKAAPRIREGARLIREWHGREHVVDVTGDGYVWQGEVWSSLSAIAREITGAHWSGPRFFGVRP